MATTTFTDRTSLSLKRFAQTQTDAVSAGFLPHAVALGIQHISLGFAYPAQRRHGDGGFAESVITADDDLVVRGIADFALSCSQGFIPAMCVRSARGKTPPLV